MESPCPCRIVQLLKEMSCAGPSDGDESIAMSSSPSSIVLLVTETLEEAQTSMPSVFGELDGDEIVIPVMVTSLDFFIVICMFGAFFNVMLLMVAVVTDSRSISGGRGESVCPAAFSASISLHHGAPCPSMVPPPVMVTLLPCASKSACKSEPLAG